MTISLPRSLAGLFALSALTAALAVPTVNAAPSAQAAHSAKAKSCDVSSLVDKLGSTTITSLKVTHVKCDAGISVVKAFTACRLKNGTQGRCVKKVKGYACAEIRTNGPTEFSANVTCKKDEKRVAHRYTQVI